MNSFVWSQQLPLASPLSIGVAWVLYFASIYSLRVWMRERKPYKLREVAVVHNLFLSIWSLAMFSAGAYFLYDRYRLLGWKELFCTHTKVEGALPLVMYSYYLSKFYELFDTLILVLKKKPLIFLHYYHHAIVILMVWSWLEYSIMYSYLGMLANTLIHVFMYYYYYAAAQGKTVWFKRYLTLGQIVQFTASFLLLIPYLYVHFEQKCPHWNVFCASMAVNASFLLLFIQFYKRAY